MKLSVTPILIAVLVVVALAGTFLVFSRRQGKNGGGFQEWVRNPDWKKAAADYSARRKALQVPNDLPESEIQQMVDRLFVERDDDFNVDRLKLVGQRAVPLLIKALHDPRIGSLKFSAESRHALSTGSPLERICDLLERFGPADAVAPLARLLDNPDDDLRKHAAMALASIGSADCVAPLLKAFDDHDEYVRSYGLMGIQRGIEAGRSQHAFLDAVFPIVTKLLNVDDGTIAREAAETLVAIDRERAVAVLLSAELLTISNSQLHDLLHTLNEARCQVPHETLLPLLRDLKPQSDKYPHDRAFAEALVAYANNPDEGCEQVFREDLRSANEAVQEGAARALAIRAGLQDPTRSVLDAKRSRGWEALSETQKLYYAAWSYDAEVRNGGHLQYFVNSSGDQWKTALRALTAVQAPAQAAILKEAVDQFGPAGPSEENETRHRQLSRLPTKQESALRALDDRYYKATENLEALLLLYAIHNKASF